MTREVTWRWEDFARAQRFKTGSCIEVGGYAEKLYTRATSRMQVGFTVADEDGFGRSTMA